MRRADYFIWVVDSEQWGGHFKRSPLNYLPQQQLKKNILLTHPDIETLKSITLLGIYERLTGKEGEINK